MSQQFSVCQNCGALLIPGNRFCEQCGSPVGTSAPASQPYFSRPVQPPHVQSDRPQHSPVYSPSPVSYGPPAQTAYSPLKTRKPNTCLIVGLIVIVLCFCISAGGLIGWWVARPALENLLKKITDSWGVPTDQTGESQKATAQSQAFYDDFSKLSTGWEVGSDESASWGYENQAYFISIREPNSFYWVLPPVDYVSTGVEFDVYSSESYPVETSGSYGAVCNYLDQDNFHFVEVDPSTQAIFIGKYVQGELMTLSQPEWIEARNLNPDSGDVNHILVNCEAGRITLYLNDQYEIEILDASIQLSGRAGIFAATYAEIPSGGYKVFFDNFSVWPPER